MSGTSEKTPAFIRCCEKQTEFIWCWDAPNDGHAHNVYACSACGAVYQQRVWDDPGVLLIRADGSATDVST